MWDFEDFAEMCCFFKHCWCFVAAGFVCVVLPIGLLTLIVTYFLGKV